jgi:glycosyltransferase involved in cell wall biosynthesis
MNSPQDSVFKKENVEITDKNSTNNMRFRIMFHGTIVERHGLDIALKVVQKLRYQIPELEFLVYGGGDFVNNFLELREKLNLKDIVHYGGEVSLEKIVSLIKTIDLGLIPNKRSPFTEINMPTRIFEYLCLGKPVVAPRTQGIMDYFNENEIYFFEPDNIQNLHDTILKAYKSNRQSSDILKRGIKIYKKYSWEKQSADFIEVYDRLCS